jgi:redox-sensitive bicupin YhaK (pirin superfamily)
MSEHTSRRGFFASGAALLATFGTWSVTSKLFGLSKERNAMQTQPSTTVSSARSVERVLSATSEHWVGDGFRVRSVISPNGDPRVQSPFLLLDHAASRYFPPATERRGVGEHPHRGFETVTFAYRGEIEHRDSHGGGGTIGAGDVQWMTAGSGLVHEEKHSQRFTEAGGELEMVQLWVNLPASKKMTTPGYQALLDRDFPRLTLGAAEARLIAGALHGKVGPAHTHSPMAVFDLRFTSEGASEFELPSGYNSLIFTLGGNVRVGSDERTIAPGQLAVLERKSEAPVHLRGEKDARVLVLSGEPLNEPVASYGPFVMNTRDELIRAVRDYESGKMGHLP